MIECTADHYIINSVHSEQFQFGATCESVCVEHVYLVRTEGFEGRVIKCTCLNLIHIPVYSYFLMMWAYLEGTAFDGPNITPHMKLAAL